MIGAVGKVWRSLPAGIKRSIWFAVFGSLDVLDVILRRRDPMVPPRRIQYVGLGGFKQIGANVFNPRGTCKASEYRFPYEDAEFDLVLLASVFTHMLPGDVSHYMSEIARPPEAWRHKCRDLLPAQ